MWKVLPTFPLPSFRWYSICFRMLPYSRNLYPFAHICSYMLIYVEYLIRFTKWSFYVRTNQYTHQQKSVRNETSYIQSEEEKWPTKNPEPNQTRETILLCANSIAVSNAYPSRKRENERENEWCRKWTRKIAVSIIYQNRKCLKRTMYDFTHYQDMLDCFRIYR